MNDIIKAMPSIKELKCIHLDFEKSDFKINDIDIGHCTDLEISFHNSKWMLSVSVNESFTSKGESVLHQEARLRRKTAEAKKMIVAAERLLKEQTAD